jgi:hypothetical protein
MPRMNVHSLLIVNKSILHYLFTDVPIDHKWNYVQFATFYHLLSHGYVMSTDYKNLKPL